MADGSKTQYLLIGSGRLARHLGFYFRSCNLTIQQWSRKNLPEFNTFSTEQDPEKRLKIALTHSTHVLLLIKDGAIAEFYAGHPELHSKVVVHCSGAYSHPTIHSAHPLMTFSDQLYDPDFYRQIFFVCEQEKKGFQALFPDLSNPWKSIPQALKPLYHALCVVSGNFTTILWQEVMKRFESRLKLPADALHLYLERTARNLENDYSGALTGPLARSDHETIQKNLNALNGDVLQDIYKAFLDLKRIDPEMNPKRRESE